MFISFSYLILFDTLQLENLKHRLRRCREITIREFPNRPDLLLMIPNPDSIDIKKLSDGAINTDTCNSAQKTRRILVAIVSEIDKDTIHDMSREDIGKAGVVHEMDCMQHLRNVWINGAAKAVSAYLKEYLEDSLEEISSHLRISPDLAQIIRAYHKEFSLTANYPKGHGELFRDWVMKNYPGAFLLHAERASGSRQDLICMGADAVYMNRPYNIEFLDERLRIKDNAHILQENLFSVLSSSEMISTTRFFSILHVCVVCPFRWLAGNTHKLKEYNWGARSMGRAIDCLYEACDEILDDVQLIYDKDYMLGLWDDIALELPEFRKYLDEMHENRMTKFIPETTHKTMPYKKLITELFDPQDDDNKESTSMLEDVALIGIEAIRTELLDQTKATYKYLSISGSHFSFDHCPESTKIAMLGMMATNDYAESSFAGVTAQVQTYGRIGMHGAAAVSDMQRNKFLARPTTKKSMANNERGLFHDLPEELRLTVTMMAMEDAPKTREHNNAAIDRQRERREEKEEIKRKKGFENASDEYIECLIYRAMYDSAACWKTISEVTNGLKKLKYKKDKLQALKDNIQMRFKGFGWDDWKTAWSHMGVQYTIQELAKILKGLITTEKKKKRTIPNKPPVPVPQRKAVPVLGTATSQRDKLDMVAREKEDELDNAARKEWRDRELKGIGSVRQNMQPLSAPELNQAFVGRKIEYLCELWDLEDNSLGLHWCSGQVGEISDGTWGKTMRTMWKKGEAVKVHWDAIKSANMEKCSTIVELKPRLWNQDGDQAWRYDLGPFNYGI